MQKLRTFNELRKVIEDRYDNLGPGTKENPINFNDIDVSNFDSFYNELLGLFEETNFKYIDISDWDVSNVKLMYSMFGNCEELESIGDISGWDISKVTDMSSMFYCCKKFNQDISCLNISKVINMSYMFYGCKSFNQDISNWDVSNVWYKNHMFDNCPIKEEYKPKFI